jgi:carbamoyl-phosphate synthase large subunit
MPNKILVTTLGSNTSIGIIKALKQNAAITIVGTDVNEPFRCNGFAFADVYYKLPYYNDVNYIATLIEIIKKEQVDCIIPIHDKEVEAIAANKTLLEQYCSIACNTAAIIELCNDKVVISNTLKDIVPVPTIITTQNEITYPLISKPISGVSSRGIEIFKENYPFEKYNSTTHFLQQCIVGVEYTVDCYSSYIDDTFVYAVRERIETKEGMSIKSQIIQDEALGNYCKAIHTKLNYKGASNIQFIKDACGNYYFIEINPRFAGAGILTYKNGLNMPLYTVLELAKKPTNLQQSHLKVGASMVRYLEETFFDAANTVI